MGNIHTVGPNKAMVVSGGCFGPTAKKTIVGGWAWAWWCVTDVQHISLEVMTLNPCCDRVETSHGVPLTVTGVAQCKFIKQDEILKLAFEQFLSKSVEEIENTILQCEAVTNCLVVPLDEGDTGETVPVACLQLRSASDLSESLDGRLKQLVFERHGESCVPIDFVLVGDIPRTYNSKPMRQVVKQLFSGTFHGEVSEIANPECMLEISATIADWLALRSAPLLDEFC